MLGVVECAALEGFVAKRVNVEVDIARGLPKFLMVGLPENSVKEARVRVESAIKNAGFDFPCAKILVNLAPADVHKNGTGFDLAIGLAILQAQGILSGEKLKFIGALGELSLTGEIRPIRGMLALAENMKEQGKRTLLVSKENAVEASLIKGLDVKIVSNFRQLVEAILENKISDLKSFVIDETKEHYDSNAIDISDVCGQEEAKRALLIAAAGNHNLLLIGGPGSGKSMMAERLSTILPPLSYEEALTVTRIYSVAGLTMAGKLIRHRPFRAPHHSITKAGLAGGGSGVIRPGEISLSTYGVLFLDELLEFPRGVLEILRQPLENGRVTLSRANNRVTFPAEFSFIGAMNPCPCGKLGQTKSKCICSPLAIQKYQSRMSGPLLDRIDLCVNVLPLNLSLMSKNTATPSSKIMRKKVITAREIQRKRFGTNLTNGKLTRRNIKMHIAVNKNAEEFLVKSAEKLGVSARGYDRLLRVARTIADLDGLPEINTDHIKEALYFRPSQDMLRNP